MSKEWIARILVAFLLIAAVLIPALGRQKDQQAILVHAHMAENGGWTPENLTVQAGQPLHLRLTSDDVTHSFAIGQSDQAPVEVLPGEISEVTLLFNKPGKYTFYCTHWCSVNHWRMRGVIEVTAPDGQESNPQPVEAPLFTRLGLDLDSPHPADLSPAEKPSAGRGAAIRTSTPAETTTREYYLTHSPLELWKTLRNQPDLQHISDQEIWDLVALTWAKQITAAQIQEGQKLYTQNCAACHGEQGRGNGVFAEQLAGPAAGKNDAMGQGQMTKRPADFTDTSMLAVSPAHLQGKIIRGGMGTGMPYWGPIFTEDQTWALVAYLSQFQFNYDDILHP